MQKYEDYTKETTLSLVYQYFESENPIVIMTGFKPDKTYEDKIACNRQLASRIKNTGFGYL